MNKKSRYEDSNKSHTHKANTVKELDYKSFTSDDWGTFSDMLGAFKVNDDLLIEPETIRSHENTNFVNNVSIQQTNQTQRSNGPHSKGKEGAFRTIGEGASDESAKAERLKTLVNKKLFTCRGVNHVNKENGMIDSGCSRFMTSDQSLFEPGSLVHVFDEYVYLGDDRPLRVWGKGKVTMQLAASSDHPIDRECEEALYVPDLAETLVSLSHLVDGTNDVVSFDKDSVYIHLQKEDKTINVGQRVGNLYFLDVEYSKDRGNEDDDEKERRRAKAASHEPKTGRTTYLYWHYVLNHANAKVVCRTLETAGIKFDFSNDTKDCVVCQLVNFRRPTTAHEATPAPRFLYTIATDMFPLKMEVYNKAKYCSFIYDKYSKYTWVLWFHNKHEFADSFISWCKTQEVKHDKLIVNIQGDRGELNCQKIRDYCDSHTPNKIDLRLSPAHTQALNGLAERPLGVYRERALCCLTVSGLPYKYFNFALDHVVLVSRFLQDKMTKKTPNELATGRAVHDMYQNLLPFGCLAATFVPKDLRTGRISPMHKAELAVYLGNKNSRIVFVYKFRTKRVHEEFNIRGLPYIFPGLTLNSELLHRFTNGNLITPAMVDQLEGEWQSVEASDDLFGPSEPLGKETDGSPTQDTAPAPQPEVERDLWGFHQPLKLSGADEVMYDGELVHSTVDRE